MQGANIILLTEITLTLHFSVISFSTSCNLLIVLEIITTFIPFLAASIASALPMPSVAPCTDHGRTRYVRSLTGSRALPSRTVTTTQEPSLFRFCSPRRKEVYMKASKLYAPLSRTKRPTAAKAFTAMPG